MKTLSFCCYCYFCYYFLGIIHTLEAFVHQRNSIRPSTPTRLSFRLPPQPPLITMPTNHTTPFNDALENLKHTTRSLQSQQMDSIRLVEKSQLANKADENLLHINSIVFSIQPDNEGLQQQEQEQQYILAVLSQYDRVDLDKLVDAVKLFTNFENFSLNLAPSDQLSRLCGFEAGCIPPLGLLPLPIMTFVEESFLHLDNRSDMYLVGGGGSPSQNVLLSLQTLLDTPVQTASFRESYPFTIQQKPTIQSKPYFSIMPPDMEIAKTICQNPTPQEGRENFLSPELLTIVGRISGIRQIARRLAFADFAPPLSQSEGVEETHPPDDHPWKNPRTTEDMAVQLILGKTIMQKLGDQQGEQALKNLKKGQLVLVQGRTNVDSLDSLMNWTTKKSLDVVVSEFQILQPAGDEGDAFYQPPPPKNGVRRKSKAKSNEVKRKQVPSGLPTMEFLKLSDLYSDGSDQRVFTIVDTIQGVEDAHDEIVDWLRAHPKQYGLVGIDCEWKPLFLAQTNEKDEAQPVLLMQICFHPLQRTFLLDLQTLLRPLTEHDSPLNAAELAISKLIQDILQSNQLIKTGFQVSNDFQKLAASYPHITEFQVVNSVLEVSKLGLRVMQLTKQPNSRTATSSLSKMTECFFEKTMNKDQQVSDWSTRPLSMEQMEYASLDAVVTPCLVEHLLSLVDATFDETPKLSRWEGDNSFTDALRSWKYFVLSPEKDNATIQRLNAKRVVGQSFVLTQSWITGREMPNEPDVPKNPNQPYTDIQGITRVPSHTISVNEDTKDLVFDDMIGRRSAKSKDGCLAQVLQHNPMFQENDYKLDFAQRSGYVEFENAVALFITMPTRPGQLRKYPNEWMEDGSILTWFVHQHEWRGGKSRLAQKMLAGNDPTVILFVRKGKEPFLFCGRCRVVPLGNGEEKTGNILKLHLMLNDWNKLVYCQDFKDLIEF